MEVVGNPSVAAYLSASDRLAGTDVRDGRVYFFSERDNDILLAGYSENGVFTASETVLFHTSGKVTGLASTDLLTIVMTDAGPEYLHHTPSGYEYLGHGPEFPVLSFGLTSVSTASAILPGCKLTGNYTQWGSPLESADKARIARQFATATKELRHAARQGGCTLQPIALTVALRLWDNSLLWSDYTTIAGDRQTPEALADVTATDGKWTVAACRLPAELKRPLATLVSPGIGRWKNLIKAVEIHACTADTPETQLFRCEQSQQGQPTCHLRMTAIESSPLLHQRKLAQTHRGVCVASITDMEALLSGELRGEGIRIATQGGIAGNSYEIELYEDSRPEEERRYSTAPFSARTITPAGPETLAGNLTFSYPEAPHLLALADATTLTRNMASVVTGIELTTENGDVSIVRSELTEYITTRLNSLISYPDHRARRMTIVAITEGDTYGITVDLQPSPSGDCAYAIKEGGFQLAANAGIAIPSTRNSTYRRHAALVSTIGGNPLQWQLCGNAANGGVTAISQSFRYGSSWLLGRSPACLFSPDGLRLLSFDKEHRCTAATLISRRTVGSPDLVAPTADGLVFVDTHGELCRYEGTKVQATGTILPEATSIGYSVRHGETWIAEKERVTVVCADGNSYHRQPAGKLHNTATGTIAALSGTLRTLEAETHGRMSVALRSRQYPLPGVRLQQAEWDLSADSADITLSVYGENGHSCHGEQISKLHVSGSLSAPLRQRLAAPPARSYRVELSGTLPTGAKIYPAEFRGRKPG